MNKRIAIIVGELSGRGGTETVISEVMNWYSGKEKISLVITQFSKKKYKQQTSWLSEKWDIQSPKTVTNNKLLKKIIGFLFSISYFTSSDDEIIICTGTKLIELGNLIRMIFRKKYSLYSWIHFSLSKPVDSINFTKIRIADKHLAISISIKRDLIMLGIPKEDIYLIYNPINKKQNTISASPQKTIFLSVGRLEMNYQKNNQELFDALSHIKNERWELLVFGSGLDFELEKKYVKKLGIEDKIQFKGWSVNPFENISNADASVMTSNFEGFPMSLIESMSYGIPVISSNIDSSIDLVNEKNGLLYNLGNTVELSNCLIKFIDKNISYNPEEVKESLSFYSRENYFKRWDDIFKIHKKREG